MSELFQTDEELQEMLDDQDGYEEPWEPDDHYSAKGGHRERSIYHQPNHEEHWKKVEKGIRRYELPDILPWVAGALALGGGAYAMTRNQPKHVIV